MTSAAPQGLPFLKGHGTENDFVIIPDPDGALDLTPAAVARLCDRRAGIGGDGVLRVVRSARHPEAAAMAAEAEWFMDYRNSDGSIAEMCGNGVRVFAHYLLRAGLTGAGDVAVATRAGVRRVHIDKDGDITVDMGRAALPAAWGRGRGRRAQLARPQREHGQPARRRLRRRPRRQPASCWTHRRGRPPRPTRTA